MSVEDEMDHQQRKLQKSVMLLVECAQLNNMEASVLPAACAIIIVTSFGGDSDDFRKYLTDLEKIFQYIHKERLK